mmetsp:Transcript_117666/g.377576  ORF Transcript_117666/g.377576 Transcript_117666/m.377576 type:complete len:119 (+) Transcript_117666:131-487(+)
MQHYMPMEKHAEKKGLDLESCIEGIVPKYLLVECRRGGCIESQPGTVSTPLTRGPGRVGTRTPSMTSQGGERPTCDLWLPVGTPCRKAQPQRKHEHDQQMHLKTKRSDDASRTGTPSR